MPPPPKPPRPSLPRSDSDRPLSEGDREFVLRIVRDVEWRLEGKLAEIEVRLANEIRGVLRTEREQDQRHFELDRQVRELATRVGRDAGDVSGREAARDVTKHTGAKATIAAMFIAAVTSGVVQGLVKAFEPVKPAPTHQPPP